MSASYNVVPLSLPDEGELAEALGTVPVEAEPADGFWAYEVGDDTGARLSLVINAFARSLEVTVTRHGHELVHVVQEGLGALQIERSEAGTVLHASAETRDTRTSLRIHVRPAIRASVATLVHHA